MGTENEISVLDIDRGEVVRRLKALSAKHEGKHRFRRIEFLVKGDVKGPHSWGRIRTDGNKTTITFKETLGKGKFTPMTEYEIETRDFGEAVKLLTKLVTPKVMVYFENERDAYRLGNAYITIDKWPEIPAYLEIEAPTMKQVKEAHRLLNVGGKLMGNAPIHQIYSEYGLEFREVMKKNDPQLKKLLSKK